MSEIQNSPHLWPLSCQGPVVQSPMSQLSGLMSVLSLVVRKAGRSKRLEGPSPPQAAGKEPRHVLTTRGPCGGWEGPGVFLRLL